MKLVVCQANRKKFISLLDNMEANFWNIENYEDCDLRGEVKKMIQLFWRLNRTYIIGSSFLVFGFIVKPVFSSGKQIPLTCWMPEGNPSPLYELTYLIQTYVLYSVIPVVVGFDIFFVSVNVRIVAQFKMLRYELKNLVAEDENETVMNLKRCTQHHKFLME